MNLRILLATLLLFGFSYAQDTLSAEEQAKREKNIQAGNPFKKFGYTPKIATLSKGKYLEWHDLDSIVRIGSFLYHVKQKQLWAYDPVSENDKIALRPEISSRWISPDPLMEEFPEWSPYNFTLNNPIKFIDPDGRMAIPFGGGDCPPDCDTNSFWEQFSAAVSGFAKGMLGGQEDAQKLAESGNHELAQKLDAKIEKQTTDLQTYADALSILPGYGLAEGAVKAEGGNISGALVSAGLGVLDVGTAGSASAVKTGAKVAVRGVPKYLYHYTNKAAAQNISKVGMQTKFSSDGFLYLTNTGKLSPLQAQIQLALPANKTLPSSLLRINTKGLSPSIIRRVQGNLPGMGAGGGTEFLFVQNIPASTIKIIR